jgi:preprotein translocase subunit SecF
MFIITNRKIFFAISLFLVVGSLTSLWFWGLRAGVDLKGGMILEISYEKSPPALAFIETAIKDLNIGSFSARVAGSEGSSRKFIIRAEAMDADQQTELIGVLEKLGEGFSLQRSSLIGPVLGKEAAQKSVISIVLVLLAIVFFITFAFRHVSEPVSSWKYGLITIIALGHDVIIPTGVFAILGRFAGVEVDTLFVTALLVVLGFSVHDTIVVFDRVRENLRLAREYREKKDFATIVGESIKQTMARSINTSLTTILALVFLYFFGAEATRYFSLTLIIGIIAGTYSSIFIASPLLVSLEKWQNKRK